MSLITNQLTCMDHQNKKIIMRQYLVSSQRIKAGSLAHLKTQISCLRLLCDGRHNPTDKKESFNTVYVKVNKLMSQMF